MYFLNYLDRNALPQARLNSLEEDLGLEGVQYNTAISILFVGYLLMQGEHSPLPRRYGRAHMSTTSAIKHVFDPDETLDLHVGLHDWLGWHLCCHRRSQELRRSCCLPILPRFCRSCESSRSFAPSRR